MVYEIAFPTFEDRVNHFTALEFSRLPVKGAPIFAAQGWNDDGQPITTFARQHLGNALTLTFTEMPRKRG